MFVDVAMSGTVKCRCCLPCKDDKFAGSKDGVIFLYSILCNVVIKAFQDVRSQMTGKDFVAGNWLVLELAQGPVEQKIYHWKLFLLPKSQKWLSSAYMH